MSVHTWGESPHGQWLLEIRNEGRYMGNFQHLFKFKSPYLIYIIKIYSTNQTNNLITHGL